MPRRQSSAALLSTVIAGGIMGLLAGYGVLSIMADKGMGPLAHKAPALQEQPSPVRIERAPRTAMNPPTRRIPSPRNRERPSRPSTGLETESGFIKKPLTGLLPDRILPSEVDESQNVPPEPMIAALPPASAKFVLQFDRPIIRCIAALDGIEPQDVLCDIALNAQLLKDATMADPEALHIVFTGLRLRDKRIHELPLQIENAGAAIEVSIVPRSQSIICEIRAQLSLPANGVEELTIENGTKLHNKLTSYLANIETFRRERSVIQRELSDRQRDLSNAQSALMRRDLNPTGVNAARVAVIRAQRAIGILERRINKGEALIRDESAIMRELAALNQIEAYVKNVAGVAQIYVRFYKGDVTIPVDIK